MSLKHEAETWTGEWDSSSDVKAIREASFIHWTLVEIRDGNTWGDLLVELGCLMADDADGRHDTAHSSWCGEAGEMAATDGYGWPGVLQLIAQAMLESNRSADAVDPSAGDTGKPTTRERSS